MQQPARAQRRRFAGDAETVRAERVDESHAMWPPLATTPRAAQAALAVATGALSGCHAMCL